MTNMQYPLISEYVRAMQDPAGNLDQLSHLVSVQDDHGEPMRSSGAFAVVFKMKDESTGKEYALKCFTEDQEGRAEAYRQIADELESVDSTYVTSVKYLEKELFVDSNCDDDEFPVLLMDWIEGETMDRYIAENLYDNYAMSMLCYRFCKMAVWLRSQPFAHGDIKPDNIMVRPDGSLTLIDYDGMFVPSMKGQTSPTIGTKDFSHPLRTKDDFDETIDDFALATIALSLKAISLTPSLFDEYASADRLLFSADDYRDLSQSKVLPALQPLMADSELNTLLSLFLLAHATKTLSMDSFRLFSVSKPECVSVVDISTDVTDEDLVEATEDEYGVKYSKDGKRLLKAYSKLNGEYHIRKGTICICFSAFENCAGLTGVVIPEGITEIGDFAFSNCPSLENILVSADNPSYVSINNCCLSKDLRKLIFGCRSSIIPEGISMIEESAFEGCVGQTSIVMPEGVKEIGRDAFSGCTGLTNIVIPDSVTEINGGAFFGCTSLTSIVIPKGITEIGESAFSCCTGLTGVVIPEGVTEISMNVFRDCTGLTGVVIPEGVKEIGYGAFSGCTGLTNIVIPNSVTVIMSSAFSGCTGLTGIVIPEGVTEIDCGAFGGCTNLTTISVSVDNPSYVSINNCCLSKDLRRLIFGCRSSIIPDGVSMIEWDAFRDCAGLTSIRIPDSVTAIGVSAFYGCNLPESVKKELAVKFGSFIFDEYYK